MALDVKVIINIIKPVGAIGFGCPLILEENAAADIAYTEVTNLDTLVKMGYTVDDKVYKALYLMFRQDHAPKKVAVCATTGTAVEWLSEENNMSKGWRQLVIVSATEVATNIAKVMTIIEGQTLYPKFYYANVAYDDTTKYSVKDVERTLLCYYTPTEDVPCPVAALAGEVGGAEIGSYTINNMVVRGIEGLELSESEIEAIHAKGGITYVVSAGDVVASEGISAGGTFVDNVDNNDYIKQQLEYKTQKVFNNNMKVPYTNTGIAMLEAAAIEVMTDAVNKNIVESFTVSYALREDTTEADRYARKYFGGNISYVMAGAIHHIEIRCDASF